MLEKIAVALVMLVFFSLFDLALGFEPVWALCKLILCVGIGCIAWVRNPTANSELPRAKTQHYGAA
jgi:hypothetical protein